MTWTGRKITDDLLRRGERYTRDVEVLWACLAGVVVAAALLAAGGAVSLLLHWLR